jgi:protein-S-isoprenylcysteine O-methyltransferase Ste14
MRRTAIEPTRAPHVVQPTWGAVSRFTHTMNVGLVVALILVVAAHGADLPGGIAAEVGVVLLTLLAAWLVSWASGGHSHSQFSGGVHQRHREVAHSGVNRGGARPSEDGVLR